MSVKYPADGMETEKTMGWIAEELTGESLTGVLGAQVRHRQSPPADWGPERRRLAREARGMQDYDPRQPRDWRGRWTKTGGGGTTEWRDPSSMDKEEIKARFNAASAEKEFIESFGETQNIGEQADFQKLKEEYDKNFGFPKNEAERIAHIEKLGLTDKTPGLGEIDTHYYYQETYLPLPEGQTLEEWKTEIKGADVAIAFHIDEIGEIIAVEGFLNQHETGSSRGMNDPDGRKALENGLWQIEGRPDSEYPVYGFLTPPNGEILADTTTVRQYGNAFAIMKPEVDEYTTFTVGDSLNNNHWWSDGDASGGDPEQGVRIPSPKLDPDPVAMGNTYRDHYSLAITPRMTADEFLDGAEYIEAQIHGGKARVENIREIRIPQSKDVIMRRMREDSDWRRPIVAFTEQGIPIMVNNQGDWETLTKADFDAIDAYIKESWKGGI